jgi:hypothetical protein
LLIERGAWVRWNQIRASVRSAAQRQAEAMLLKGEVGDRGEHQVRVSAAA